MQRSTALFPREKLRHEMNPGKANVRIWQATGGPTPLQKEKEAQQLSQTN